MRLLTETTKHHVKQLVKIAINFRGNRAVYVREEVFDLLRPFSPTVAAERDGVRYHVSTDDSGLSRTVFSRGSYELDVMSYALKLAETWSGRRPLLEGRTFIDIGANIGTSTVPALVNFGARDAVAIEPEPETFKLLRCNLIANDLDDLVKTLRVALSDHTGGGVLERADRSWGDHRVRRVEGLPDGLYLESVRPTLEVRLRTFDDVARELSIDLLNVGVVWMDVQGHEGQVLAGASSVLESEIPVIMEYWPYGLRRADGLALLHDLIAKHYRRVVDVRASMAGSSAADLPAREVARLADRYPDETYTDLILVS